MTSVQLNWIADQLRVLKSSLISTAHHSCRNAEMQPLGQKSDTCLTAVVDNLGREEKIDLLSSEAVGGGARDRDLRTTKVS